MAASSLPMCSRRRRLSMVRICSSSTTESFVRPTFRPVSSMCVGSFALFIWLVIAAAITSQTGKANLPTHISLAARSCGLTRDSVILLEQVRTLDKSRLRERMGRLDEPAMHQVDNAIAVSFGLPQ